MTDSIQVVLASRHGVQGLIDQYADGKIPYGELKKGVADLGYSTRSLWEMTRHIPERPPFPNQGVNDDGPPRL
jgi:hypothetical protein